MSAASAPQRHPRNYRVALTGAQGTGKTWMVEHLHRRLRSAGFTVEKITSPTRAIMRLGNFSNNTETSFDLQMMLMAERAKAQFEAAKRSEVWLGSNRGSEDRCVIIADRCNLDELAYLEERVDSATKDSRYVYSVAHLFEEAPMATMRAFIPLATRFCFDRCEEFWDAVYYKPPHPEYPPEADDERDGTSAYQSSVDTFMRKNHTYLGSRGKIAAYTAKIDREEALEQIYGNIIAHFEEAIIDA